MPPETPYSADLDDRDPIEAMRDSLGRLRQLTRWSSDDFERTYAPGKWSAREVLVHLAQSELAFGSRARLALTTPDYQVGRSVLRIGWVNPIWLRRPLGASGRSTHLTHLAYPSHARSAARERRGPRVYSSASATTGSTRAARRAGR
ncbi:MAG TPA: hypothetical protein VKE51_19125 [Vicinamibacterales bacterium]|nr:hypothetical protein [Vicinamibacterales bacterium]